MLADLVLLVHFAFVLFIVGGFAAILTGAALGWNWIRHRGFRIAHLAAMAFVALESLAGIACPLTVWENALRGSDTDRSFIGAWITRLLYYDLPEWVFTATYLLLVLAMSLAWHFIPPARRGGLSLRP